MFIPTGRLIAIAHVKGGEEYPEISGTIKFYQNIEGTMVEASIFGLPQDNKEGSGIFAMHIHNGKDCGGKDFANADGHYNPDGKPHPYHAGDLPPLFETRGHAFMAVLIGRFSAAEIIGRTVIIHRNVDDFTTQPSGSGGKMIACGVIESA
jgi:Cu-Zn family superoxide dismutase